MTSTREPETSGIPRSGVSPNVGTAIVITVTVVFWLVIILGGWFSTPATHVDDTHVPTHVGAIIWTDDHVDVSYVDDRR
jgi:hypothetical protein